MGWTESQISFTYQRHMTFTPPINEYSKKFQLFAHFFCQCTSSSEKTYIGEKYQLFLLLSVCYVKCCNYYYYYYYFYKVEDKTVNIPPPSPSSLIIDPSPSHIKCLCFSILYSTCVLYSTPAFTGYEHTTKIFQT